MSEMFEVVFEWMQTMVAASFLLSNCYDRRNHIIR